MVKKIPKKIRARRSQFEIQAFKFLRCELASFLYKTYFDLDPADLLLPNFHSSFLDFIRTVISGKDNYFTCSPDLQNLTQMTTITVMSTHGK